jgi:hypothetical protein
VIAHSGDIRRFHSAAAPTRFCGAAPIPCGSGKTATQGRRRLGAPAGSAGTGGRLEDLRDRGHHPLLELCCVEGLGFAVGEDRVEARVRSLANAIMEAGSMPRIEGYRFGHIVVDGEEQTGDVMVLSEHVLTGWWRANGHRRLFADLTDVIEDLPERLPVGTGACEQMRPGPETLEALRQCGVEVEALPTDEAVRRYGGSTPAARRTRSI